MKTEAEIRAGLEELSPEIPWTHYFNLNGIETITPEQDKKYYQKSQGLIRVGEIAARMASHNLPNGLEGARVLDIASAEGFHSIELAKKGAREVVGIEGRQLYVNRATFAAETLGLSNVKFIQGDVRRINPAEVGTFDFVLCSGILHHLGKDDFEDFVKLLGQLTSHTLMLYTHVTNERSVERFRLAPTDPVVGRFAGSLFREHKDNATEEQKRAKVRASLDNTFSFWAEEPSLIEALLAAGFESIDKVMHPRIFDDWDERTIRIVLNCRKAVISVRQEKRVWIRTIANRLRVAK